MDGRRPDRCREMEGTAVDTNDYAGATKDLRELEE
jgi:hypothetical protein